MAAAGRASASNSIAAAATAAAHNHRSCRLRWRPLTSTGWVASLARDSGPGELGGWAAPPGRAMVRGSGWRAGDGSRTSHAPNVVRPATTAVESGVVQMGTWADRPEMVSRIDHWLVQPVAAPLAAMALIRSHRRDPRRSMLMGDSVFGVLLTAAGLEIAFLALATPFSATLSSTQLSGSGHAATALGISSISLIAAGALLLAGANRLSATLLKVRRHPSPGPAARALAQLADEVTVLGRVVPSQGRAIPELAIGPFGAAVIHALPPPRDVRRAGASWELRTPDGWRPMDNPLDLATRDAEQVRRWFSTADLDFVVRVYAALVVTDASLPRSAACAVLTADQLPGWIAALPRQRSLTAARCFRLAALAAPGA